MTPRKRDYKHEYATYQGKPEQIRNRAQRNAARASYEKVHGNLPSTTEIDHKRMIKDGGTNAKGNLRAVPQAKNRGWRKGHRGPA